MYLLFDIGGTKMRVAYSRDGHAFEEPRIVATPQNFAVGMQTIERTARELSAGRPLRGVAGGIAGSLDESKEKVFRAGNLSDWAGKPLKKELEKIFHTEVFLENDAALGALGEAVAGVGKGKAIVAYLTISTGVGGARIVNGEIDESVHGFEPGHQIIDIIGAGKKEQVGTLQNYVSGAALEKRLGMHPGQVINGAVWDELARHLAYGLHNTIVHWSPNLIVLGGSMILGKNGIKIQQVEKYLKEISTVFQELPDIKEATLGDFSALHGALELIRSHSQKQGS